MKVFRLALAAAAAIALAAPAMAGPIAYSNTPFSTPQELVNGLVTTLNGSLPTAATNQTATATAGAATLNGVRGTVTSESLTTAAGSTYTLTLTNSSVVAASQVLVTVGNGTNAAGSPVITTVTPAAGSVVIVVQNIASAAALNGTLKFNFLVVN